MFKIGDIVHLKNSSRRRLYFIMKVHMFDEKTVYDVFLLKKGKIIRFDSRYMDGYEVLC